MKVEDDYKTDEVIEEGGPRMREGDDAIAETDKTAKGNVPI